eukprot:CAMPEP_0177648600 /NCGR_PEP_ID=MMETSP0447-20121125/10913_1 /TAXON_ID=0 /ORGANISM="Stygamoeba regulata, Strain BSH-02190019" /LENGTH=369 /DNA_ID=CAMNT_0019151249 /DNA_START=126 /DNA_END=1235 /DNA_ORIENTATION=-
MAAAAAPAVIIDIGTATTTAGFSTDEKATFSGPTLVGKVNPAIAPADAADLKGYFFGEEARQKRALLTLHHPVQSGVVENWEDMERYLDFVITRALNIADSGQHPFVVSEPPINPKGNRESMAQLFFETFNAPLFYLASRASLTLKTTGHDTGLVLSSGAGGTFSTPVYKGSVLRHAITQNRLSGRDIDNYLTEQMKQSGYTIDPYEAQTIKHKLLRILKNPLKHTDLKEKKVTLETGAQVSLTAKHQRSAEILFEPSMMGKRGADFIGIHETVKHSVDACEPEIRKDLCSNIFLCGGSTAFEGFTDRLQYHLAHELKDYDVHITPIPDPQSAWNGGKLMANEAGFSKICVTRQAYEESGAQCVHTMCY